MIFLLEYDRNSGKLIAQATFTDSLRPEAESARLALELRNLEHGIEHEVVLLDAASEEKLRVTHKRYFESLGTLARSSVDFALGPA
jgi:hypothetical protein